MINQIISYIQKMFATVEKPQTYGSALEEYIVSKNPTSTHDVEYHTRQFDQKMAARRDHNFHLPW